MIHKIYVDNYRCLVNCEVLLDDLSLLLGPNGAGKSSLLDVVHALRLLLGGRAKVTDREVFPTSTLTRWQDCPVQVFELGLRLDKEDYLYRLEVEHDRARRRGRIVLERLTSGGKPLFEFIRGEVYLYRDDHSEGPVYSADWSESAMARVGDRHDNQRLNRFLACMRRVIVCNLDPRRFLAESVSEEVMLARDGHDFSAWYRHISQERQELVVDYIRALRNVIDGFDGIRLETVGVESRAFRALFRAAEDHRYELALDELSDGQRALLALYALVFMTAGQGYILFLDEPDNFVALPEIQPWLMELCDAVGDSLPQVVLCSHHPEMIDYLAPEHALLFQSESSGAIRVTHPVYRGDDKGIKLSELIARGWENGAQG